MLFKKGQGRGIYFFKLLIYKLKIKQFGKLDWKLAQVRI